MNFQELEHLGEPDLSICGLRLWIHGRQFPAATDYWDGNWLRVTVYCLYPHSVVRIQNDPCIRVDELAGLLRGCEQMHATLSGKAALQCMEPYLAVELAAATNGHIGVKLSITADNMTETHEYEDEIDQSYLPSIISSCQAILARFPLCDPKRKDSSNGHGST
ncbi:WapI family immunity protein [Massilia sp. PWRC2]|uniref:WapI family immunity protein n=1 Tax=Massilia sp. PWRC2 TaxID=2804626 RepID=UPI003CEA360E